MKFAAHKLVHPQMLVLFVIIFVFGCFTGCQEAAKWEFAQALNLEESGDAKSALAMMKTVVEKAPKDVGMKLEYARALSRANDQSAISICDELLEGGSLAKFDRLNTLMRKADCQQHLGDFEGALATYKKRLAGHLERNSTELNNLAYFRALANRELMMAARDIETAVEDEALRQSRDVVLPLEIRSYIAVALVSRHTGQQQKAIKSLSKLIDELESDYAKLQAAVSLTITSQIENQFPLTADQENESLGTRQQEKFIRGILATIYCTRGLLHQDLGDEELCGIDQQHVVDLGSVPKLLANQLPTDYQCMETLRTAMTYLDTRGYVMALLPWDEAGLESLGGSSKVHIGSYRKAVADLTMALDATRALKDATSSSLYNLPDLSPANVLKLREQVTDTEGVVLYHRMLAHRRFGDSVAAQSDYDAIKDLGFDPDQKMF